MEMLKRALTIGKAIMRNGYDAHAINAPLQKLIYEATKKPELDLACECDLEALAKIFSQVEPYDVDGAMAIMREDELTIYFYRTEVEDAVHPERMHRRITSRMLRELHNLENKIDFNTQTLKAHRDSGEFLIISDGRIRFAGIPVQTLSRNYLLAIRALRYAANYELQIEPQTWMAIIQATSRILDYVAAREIMDEWRQVGAESMWYFVQLLYKTHLLHGLMPEVAALACVKQDRDDSGELETVFDHTINAMREYPTGEFAFDWYGTFAMLLHNVGKLYAAEFYDGKWTFYQHHRVGANVTRKIMRRLHFSPEDIDLVAHLVRHYILFHFMLTDKGLRRFKALTETDRLVAMCAASIKASNGSYTSFNHNMKYIERTETDALMLEPLLNGNEIMEHTNLPPGPQVGDIRIALLNAQIAGDVVDLESAVAFVKNYD